MANQILICSVDHMLQHMCLRLLDNADALCFVLLLSSHQLAPLFSGREVCCITWSKLIPVTGLNTLRSHEGLFLGNTALPLTSTCTFDLRGSNSAVETLCEERWDLKQHFSYIPVIVNVRNALINCGLCRLESVL